MRQGQVLPGLMALALNAVFSIAGQAAMHSPPEKADDLYKQKEWTQAAAAYEELTKQQPSIGLYWYLLAVCRLSLKDYQSALAVSESALAHGVPAGPASYNVACAQARLGNPDAAIASLEKSVAAGFADAKRVTAEGHFTSLHDDPRYRALVDKLENPTKGMKGADALDHWVGEWNVYVADRLVGKNRIVKTLKGFGVEEYWDAGSGGHGRSLFVFLPSTGTWKQLWTSDKGWTVEKVGTPVENGIYLEGTSTLVNGVVSKSREYLTRNPDGTVRQLIEDWDEATKTWKVMFDGKYVRKEK